MKPSPLWEGTRTLRDEPFGFVLTGALASDGFWSTKIGSQARFRETGAHAFLVHYMSDTSIVGCIVNHRVVTILSGRASTILLTVSGHWCDIIITCHCHSFFVILGRELSTFRNSYQSLVATQLSFIVRPVTSTLLGWLALHDNQCGSVCYLWLLVIICYNQSSMWQVGEWCLVND